MKNYKTFIIFLILVAIWSSFFTTIKFYYWWELSSTLDMSLQTISWYLSFGWIFAYLIWWALASTFLKKYLLFFISLFTLLFVFVWWFIWFDSKIFFILIISFIWLTYWLWSIVKNVLIAIEIKKTWLSDTLVNALAWISFVVFIIIWSILGSLLHERLWENWYFVIIWLLVFTCILSLGLTYNKLGLKHYLLHWFKPYYVDRKQSFVTSMKEYVPDIKIITKKYYVIMISSSLLWAISTIVSQSAVEYSEKNFDKLSSEAAIILLFSAVWVIIWNILSVKMNKLRWKYFFGFNLIFSLLIICFPFAAISFMYVKIYAFFIGIFFGVASNLIDAYFFKKIWDENKKEYGSSTYWLILSIVIFVMMSFTSFINAHFWFEILMFILWTIVFILWFFNLKRDSF